MPGLVAFPTTSAWDCGGCNAGSSYPVTARKPKTPTANAPIKAKISITFLSQNRQCTTLRHASACQVSHRTGAPEARLFGSETRGRTTAGGDGRPCHWIDCGTHLYRYQSGIEAMGQAATLLRELYSARSTVVHIGIARRKLQEKISDFDSIVSDIVCSLLNRGAFPDWKRLVLGADLPS